MQKYFAAANSGHGFVSWFDNIFDPRVVDHTYIIKGGSGTGKSTLMKKAAAKAEALGHNVEYFYCSSDASSLDGMIATDENGRTTAMLDGTAPHTRDPKFPGVCDEIVNLGSFWDAGKLSLHKDDIITLSGKKSELFSGAYKCFGVAETLTRAELHEAKDCVLQKKLDAAVMRLLTKRMHELHVRAGLGKMRIRGLSALSTGGEVYYNSFDDPEAVYTAVDVIGTAPLLFESVVSAAKALGLSHDVAPTPLIPELYEAVRLPELKMSIVSRTNRTDAKPINMNRFIDRDKAASLDRARRRGITKGIQELKLNGLEKLSEVRRVHESIERIYISAMDFDKLEAYTDKLLSKMF